MHRAPERHFWYKKNVCMRVRKQRILSVVYTHERERSRRPKKDTRPFGPCESFFFSAGDSAHAPLARARVYILHSECVVFERVYINYYFLFKYNMIGLLNTKLNTEEMEGMTEMRKSGPLFPLFFLCFELRMRSTDHIIFKWEHNFLN